MAPKKKILIIVSTLIIILLIVLGAIFIFINNQKTSTNNSNPVSAPISSPVVDTAVAEDNIISLRRPSVDSRKPFTDDIFTFNIGPGNYQINEISPTSKFLVGEEFTLYFGAIAEGSGGIFESLPEYKDIPNKLNETITRVRAYKNNSNLIDLFENEGQSYSNNYFYSSSIEVGCTPAPSGYCGSEILSLGVKENGDHMYMEAYCLTNNQLNVEKCDEVISNMTFKLSTLKTYEFSEFPVTFSYPEEVEVTESTNGVIVTANGNEMKIVPNQRGIGFEEPAPQETILPLKVNGQDLVINGKVITKTKLFFSDTNTTSYLIIIPYSDTSTRGYSIMISYPDVNQETIDIFDNIIKSLVVG